MEYISVTRFAEKHGISLNDYLRDICLTAQDQHKALLEYFKIKD
jgi:hypothetical protein